MKLRVYHDVWLGWGELLSRRAVPSVGSLKQEQRRLRNENRRLHEENADLQLEAERLRHRLFEVEGREERWHRERDLLLARLESGMNFFVDFSQTRERSLDEWRERVKFLEAELLRYETERRLMEYRQAHGLRVISPDFKPTQAVDLVDASDSECLVDTARKSFVDCY